VLMIVLKFLVMYTVISIALALIIGPVMKWGLHYEPPELPPLPSGSLREGSQ
jgi:hypothetical protein